MIKYEVKKLYIAYDKMRKHADRNKTEIRTFC